MKQNQPSFGLLTGNQLKLIALVTMTCDHVAKSFFPRSTLLLILGRLAFPIFAWMIAEGCTYTKNRKRYLLQLAGLGAVCQAVYFFAAGSLYMCILVTFTLSVLLIYALDNAVQKRTAAAWLAACGTVAGVAALTVVLPQLPTGTDYQVDYGWWGVLLPVAVYFGRGKAHTLCMAAAAMIPLCLFSGGYQWWSLAALPLLAMYNGRRGRRKLKNLFYFYYPLHLAGIWLIDLIV